MSMMLSRVERSWWWTIIPLIFEKDWIELMMNNYTFTICRGLDRVNDDPQGLRDEEGYGRGYWRGRRNSGEIFSR